MANAGFILVKERFLFFGRNSGIHGLNHLFKENAIILARLFWLTIIVTSAGCVYLLMAPVVMLDGGISFTPDTLYLNWTSTFPGVTVCDLYSSSAAKSATQKFQELYPELLKPLSFDQIRHMMDLIHGRGRCTARRCFPCGPLVPCDVPWRTIVEKVHKKCEEILTDCSYLGKEFSCCNAFKQVDSEFGPCYAFNTMQNADFLKDLRFTVNITTGPAALSFRLLSNAKVSIHSPEELSTENLGAEYKFPYYLSAKEESEILFSMVEIENDPLVVHEDISERKCHFPHEIPKNMLHTYPTYSYGACNLAKSTEHAFEHCGCIAPVRDRSYEKFYCNYTGWSCLVELDAKIKVGLETDEENHEKDCLPSCVETELFIIYNKRVTISDPDVPETSRVTVKMASIPTLRYHRNVLRTRLDFVVSVGGMAGLFFSASVLSVVEILYLMLRSPSKSIDKTI